MRAVCPNDPTHKEFITVASVMQDWKVDENGEFLDAIPGGECVLHKPDPGNIWTCTACGAEAVVQ